MVKVMGVDMNGKEVKNGDWMVEDGGDFAYFFKIEEGKPVVKASWTCGSLGLIDFDGYIERMTRPEAHEISRKHALATKERLDNITFEKLELVPERLTGYLNQLDPNGKAFWAMEGTVKRPRPYEKPYGTLTGSTGEF